MIMFSTAANFCDPVRMKEQSEPIAALPTSGNFVNTNHIRDWRRRGRERDRAEGESSGSIRGRVVEENRTHKGRLKKAGGKSQSTRTNGSPKTSDISPMELFSSTKVQRMMYQLSFVDSYTSEIALR